MSNTSTKKLLLSALQQRSRGCRPIRFNSSTQNDRSIPLSKPLRTVNARTTGAKFNPNTATQVTKLPNGLTVASEDHWGQFATLGVLVNSGSRNEVPYASGVNHFLEKLAFSSTDKYESREEIQLLMEKYGGLCDCQGSRDTMIHAVSLQKDGLETATDILSQAVLKPKFTDTEVLHSQQVIAFELETMHMNPNKEQQMMDLIHAAAYRNNSLGRSKMCPPENIESIDRKLLFTYLKHHYTADQMVLAGSGMSHERLVELAQQYFTVPPTWADMTLDDQYEPDRSYAQYTGGVQVQSADLSNVSLGPTPMPELAHVCIAMESCSHQDEDFVAFCVLNTLMGGGGSFSAGGPGKGMFTRLYTNVLNRHYWMENATAFNLSYAESGLFIFYGSAHPNRLTDMVKVLTTEYKRMTQPIDKAELDRAKRQLQSMLMMNLESRPIVFEDIGRQVLSSGMRRQPQYFYDKIEAITETDVRNAARKLFKSPVSMAALGNLSRLPDIDLVKEMMSLEKPSLTSRLLYNR